MISTRSELLTAIRNCRQYAETADSDDERFLLEAGVMPKETLKRVAGKYPERLIKECGKKLFESPNYLRGNPHDRTRPIATDYDIEKPRVTRHYRNSTAYRVFGRDRLALWYAAANHDLTGSKGEGYGLWLILKFWRLKNIQRAWKRHIQRPNWKLPEDAK